METNAFFIRTSIIGFVALFIITVSLVTYYTATGPDKITNTQQSENKMTSLNEALRSAMGNHWPVILALMTLLLLAALVCLYLLTGTDTITLNLSDTASQRFNLVAIIFTAIFGIFVIVLSIKAYLNYNQTNNSIPNYRPSNAQSKQNTQILAIIGLGLFILTSIGLGLWYWFKKN